MAVIVRTQIGRAEAVVRAPCLIRKIPRSSTDPCVREAWIEAAAGSVVAGRVTDHSVVKFLTRTSDQGDGSCQGDRRCGSSRTSGLAG